MQAYELRKVGVYSIAPLTGRFKHFMALAVDPQRGPRGAGAARMTCRIPDLLITEILQGMAEMMDLGGKVVLEYAQGSRASGKLCCGPEPRTWESTSQVAGR